MGQASETPEWTLTILVKYPHSPNRTEFALPQEELQEPHLRDRIWICALSELGVDVLIDGKRMYDSEGHVHLSVRRGDGASNAGDSDLDRAREDAPPLVGL
jgi:hypothetical protein